MSMAKLKSYYIDENIKILKCLDQPGMDRKSVREKYGLSEYTLRGFIKNKAQLVEKFKSCSVERALSKFSFWAYFLKIKTLLNKSLVFTE